MRKQEKRGPEQSEKAAGNLSTQKMSELVYIFQIHLVSKDSKQLNYDLFIPIFSEEKRGEKELVNNHAKVNFSVMKISLSNSNSI